MMDRWKGRVKSFLFVSTHGGSRVVGRYSQKLTSVEGK
jgi:hypothetical protein